MKNEKNFKNALNCLYKLNRKLNEKIYQADAEEKKEEIEAICKEYRNNIEQFTTYFGLPASLSYFILTLEEYDYYGEEGINKSRKTTQEGVQKEILNVVQDIYLEE